MHCAEFAGYCTATPPTLLNAVSGIVSTVVGGKTTFTCNFGYYSTGGMDFHEYLLLPVPSVQRRQSYSKQSMNIPKNSCSIHYDTNDNIL